VPWRCGRPQSAALRRRRLRRTTAAAGAASIGPARPPEKQRAGRSPLFDRFERSAPGLLLGVFLLFFLRLSLGVFLGFGLFLFFLGIGSNSGAGNGEQASDQGSKQLLHVMFLERLVGIDGTCLPPETGRFDCRLVG